MLVFLSSGNHIHKLPLHGLSLWPKRKLREMPNLNKTASSCARSASFGKLKDTIPFFP